MAQSLSAMSTRISLVSTGLAVQNRHPITAKEMERQNRQLRLQTISWRNNITRIRT